jgi:hypothetical protein
LTVFISKESDDDLIEDTNNMPINLYPTVGYKINDTKIKSPIDQRSFIFTTSLKTTESSIKVNSIMSTNDKILTNLTKSSTKDLETKFVMESIHPLETTQNPGFKNIDQMNSFQRMLLSVLNKNISLDFGSYSLSPMAQKFYNLPVFRQLFSGPLSFANPF